MCVYTHPQPLSFAGDSYIRFTPFSTAPPSTATTKGGVGGLRGKNCRKGGAAVQVSPTINFQSKAILIVFIENNCG